MNQKCACPLGERRPYIITNHTHTSTPVRLFLLALPPASPEAPQPLPTPRQLRANGHKDAPPTLPTTSQAVRREWWSIRRRAASPARSYAVWHRPRDQKPVCRLAHRGALSASLEL